MVATKGGVTVFEFPEDAVVVAVHLEAYITITGATSFNLRVGSDDTNNLSLIMTATMTNVNIVGVQVSSYGTANIIDGSGSVSHLDVNKGDKVNITSNTTTGGDLFACVYYHQ